MKLNLELEKSNCLGDVGCSNNEKKPEDLILAELTSLPISFPAMKKLTYALLTTFGSYRNDISDMHGYYGVED
jgi:hypothetical protein